MRIHFTQRQVRDERQCAVQPRGPEPGAHRRQHFQEDAHGLAPALSVLAVRHHGRKAAGGALAAALQVLPRQNRAAEGTRLGEVHR